MRKLSLLHEHAVHVMIGLSYLILEALRSDHEVKQSNFDADLGEVVGIPQFGRNVKPEVVAELG